MQNKYPLWKNLLLIVIAVIGLVYAIPNLFGEDPVLQISSQASVAPQELEVHARQLLDAAKIKYRNMSMSDEGLEVRFASTDTQLLARDVIKNGLGSQYTVALNLAPSTPAWLRVLHAEPMKQGLDLRGGVHFLLEVDIDSVINRRYEGMTKNIGQDLRESGVRYAGIRYIVNKGVDLRFRTTEARDDALSSLEQKIPGLEFVKSKDGVSLMASLSPTELKP